VFKGFWSRSVKADNFYTFAAIKSVTITFMTPQPGIWGRMVAASLGEVNTKILEAYRRAGNTIHDQLHAAENRRLERQIAGESPWTASTSSQLELLFTWNAHVLQVLGDKFLDADYSAQPLTAGFVPRVTYDQVEAFYAQVEGWLSRSRQAASNPSYKSDVYLPATLPTWAEVEPCPRPHLDGIMAAICHIRTHAEAAMKVFEDDGTPKEKQEVLNYLRQLFAEANTKSDYIEGLWQPNASLELHERIEEQAKIATESYYRLGQLLAMPSLAEEALKQSKSLSKPQRGHNTTPIWSPLPGQPGFDLWVMQRNCLKRNSEAKKAIENMWKYDPNPRRTLGLFAEIEAARERGDVAYAKNPDGTPYGFYMCTPYPSIYEVKHPVTIHGKRLGTAQRFTFEASPEAVLLGKEFEFGLLVSDFRPAAIDYCDPAEPSIHDE
jgi:hypothetical protein